MSTGLVCRLVQVNKLVSLGHLLSFVDMDSEPHLGDAYFVCVCHLRKLSLLDSASCLRTPAHRSRRFILPFWILGCSEKMAGKAGGGSNVRACVLSPASTE